MNPEVPIGIQFAVLLLAFFPATVFIDRLLVGYGWTAGHSPSIILIASGLCGTLLVGMLLALSFNSLDPGS